MWRAGTKAASANTSASYRFDFRADLSLLRFLPLELSLDLLLERLLELLLELFFGGTFFPSRLASDKPIAIACLRLLTFLPDLPLLNVPALRFFIARPTLADAFFEYFRAMTLLPCETKQSSRVGKVP